MTELDSIRDAGPPREEGTVRWLAGGFEPVWGFFVYGVLWLFVAIALALIVPEQLFRLLGLTLKEDASVLRVVGLSFLLAWVPFFLWVRWRRAGARRLFRDGVLLQADIESIAFGSRRGVDSTVLKIAFASGGDARRATVYIADHQRQLAAGETIPVLFVPKYRFCAVFPTSGAPVPAACRRR